MAGFQTESAHSYDGQPSQRVFFFRVTLGVMPNREKGFFLFYYLSNSFSGFGLGRREAGEEDEKDGVRGCNKLKLKIV